MWGLAALCCSVGMRGTWEGRDGALAGRENRTKCVKENI